MATFAASANRGMVIDRFITPQRSQQVVRVLSEEQRSFMTQILVSRRLGASSGEGATTAPSAQRVRCLRRAPRLDRLLEHELTEAFRRAIGQMVPQARWASKRALSVFALDGGATLRLDLANGPALATDVILTFACREGALGPADVMLRYPRSVYSERCSWHGMVYTERALREGEAALTPALWPAELVAQWSGGHHGRPLFVGVVLVDVRTGN
jgi:hypothetical protein